MKAVWDVTSAFHETTPTRERICINGLWRWQPAKAVTDLVPPDNWGYFKVPGCWPGITDYMQKDCQTVFAHPSWKDINLGGITTAWYQREITIPTAWIGRHIAVTAEYLNSYAVVYVDGKQVGEMRFPSGEVDLTPVCQPGGKYVLSMMVEAMPLKAVMLSYSDTASAKEVKGAVERRGLCGDVYLTSTPTGAQLTDISISTSVRRWEITFDVGVQGLARDGRCAIRATVSRDKRRVEEFTSPILSAGDIKEGRLTFKKPWKPDHLWDTATPQNTYDISLSLLDAGGKTLDTAYPVRCGFREFWFKGRDFYLNGTRLTLAAVPLDNAQVGAAWATYAGARESLERLKAIGINFVYTHNYGCEPGTHLAFNDILRAADDVGMLVALSQPHFSQYEWKDPDADRTNGYARHARFYVQVAQGHPSVVAYAMSHNATGYNEDMNPDLIDGIHDVRDQWALNNAKLALRAEAIVQRLDSSRIVYHHASGNLGSMHAINFYPNFTPIQELSDWFEHWATQGVKPVFLCEYGAPFTWDWTMYRGWYKGQRTFGSARVPWEFCLAEWDAQFLGDHAYQLTDMEKANLRWEAKQFRAGALWYRWDYPYEVGSNVFDDRQLVLGRYLTDNWRAFRTWGVAAYSPWEYGQFWKRRDGVDRSRKELPVDWDNLQRPGFSPDYVNQRYERMDLAFERSDWIPTVAAQALLRNNRPLLAYIGGKAARFTSKDHNFYPGATVEKQLILINNSRTRVTCDCVWTCPLPRPMQGTKPIQGTRKVVVTAGEQQRIPIQIELPATVTTGTYQLGATVRFSNGESQQDTFDIHVMPHPPSMKVNTRIALYDPAGETASLLDHMQVPYQRVQANTDLIPYQCLIVGKRALTIDDPGPDVSRVRDGLKVIVFEQTPEVLEQRLGFRVAAYGLRQVFKRVSDHPALAGLGAENLRDWKGEATILPPRLKYQLNPRFNGAPTVEWCGLDVTRVWRAGCQGNIASALIEKPTRGDFLPLLDGGFSLQYSPLMEYHEGQGMVLFCQVDVTGRSENDPGAERLVHNLMDYVSTWKPPPRRQALYIGDPAGATYLQDAGVTISAYSPGSLTPDKLLVVGPGGGKPLAASATAIGGWLQAGGRLLTIGLDETEANAFLPFKVSIKPAEHIGAFFEPFKISSSLVGVGPSDVHNRDPREMSLVAGGNASVQPVGDGVLATAANQNIVFCGIVPWQFADPKQENLRRTYRRTSFLMTRLLANLGAVSVTPLLNRFHNQVVPSGGANSLEKRWLVGLYQDQPQEWDDPYRFFRW
ncbi:MAG: hypothetical protein JO316_26610 [Abitibacteriaceae bacterium]|nr:hypothetical protein [Abditibacteriaceae bacterium]